MERSASNITEGRKEPSLCPLIHVGQMGKVRGYPIFTLLFPDFKVQTTALVWSTTSPPHCFLRETVLRPFRTQSRDYAMYRSTREQHIFPIQYGFKIRGKVLGWKNGGRKVCREGEVCFVFCGGRASSMAAAVRKSTMKSSRCPHVQWIHLTQNRRSHGHVDHSHTVFGKYPSFAVVLRKRLLALRSLDLGLIKDLSITCTLSTF